MEHGYDLEVFKNQIVYSTNSNFEFVYLNSMFVANPLRPYERKYDIVIVDEVDNMFIDQGTSPALLSESCDIIHYEDILNVIYYNRQINNETLQDLMNKLFGKCAFFNTDEELKKIIDLKKAALSSDKKIRDIDYIVKDGKVIIIDSNTGLKKPESKWTSSIHEMVEIKEGITPSHHSVTYTAVTQHDFFNLYNKILGVTGTVGTEKDRKDLKSIYGVEIFKCPRHFLKEKKIYHTERPEGLDKIFISLNKEIHKEIKKKRPVLVIMDNIRNVDDYVAQSPLKNIKTIKGINPDDDEESRNIAGQEGNITIATSAAGRGVDIKLSKISLNNGGLHVIIPFLMPNQRALEQAAGRCGRQGQPGSVNIYHSKDDYYFMSKAFDIKEHNLWITQNKLVEYLHKEYSFLFKGKGENRIPDIELPSCMPIVDVFEVCSLKIIRILNIFKENKEIKIFDYILDMIKITWGLLFNELTKDYNCEQLSYCETKLNEYLNYLKKYIPFIIKECKKKLENQKNNFEIAFGTVKFAAYGLSMAFCPEFTPFIMGGINVGKELIDALINDEKINWLKVFLKFGQGALEGIFIENVLVKGIINLVATPLFEYTEAKIDGKDYNLSQGVNRKILEKCSEMITHGLSKTVVKPIKEALKDISFTNEGLKKMIEKFNKLGDKKLLKKINEEIKNFGKNLVKSYEEENIRLVLHKIVRMLDEATGSTLIGNSDIEDEIFDNTAKKAYKKTVNDFRGKKYNRKNNNSSNNDINKGLMDIKNSNYNYKIFD